MFNHEEFRTWIDTLRAQVSQEAARYHTTDRIPETLYHYTNANGFHGIVNSGGLWATDARYLNDEGEIEYGRGIFTEVLQEISKETSCASVRFFAGHAQRFAMDRDIVSVYLICFCGDGNILSQWRAYGGTQASYALGFNAKKLAEYEFKSFPARWQLLPVIYDRDRQIEIAKSVVAPIVAFLERDFGNDDSSEQAQQA